ncbi:ABC transporter ATP-binding protein [Staphylococcus agnetis]|uniref:staphylopine uptake ABC transporter ATP-binding protein CntD n=1 Tax=Staphylococcus agnetis TaxID=985762 RepID=UPI0021D0907B|nr:ABC transporter ATP-binding protein [Staphylococcus agnetis]UXU54867.1 ABC transporter ATP-binding protein [Staphylococcus agnetis]
MSQPILDVQKLTLIDGNTNHVLVHQCSFSLEKGKILAIIGESGSGKSITCKALLGLNDHNIQMSGSAHFNTMDLLQQSEAQLRHIRGNEIAMIMQQGGTAFNPSFSLGYQMRTILKHHNITDAATQKTLLKSYFDMLGLHDFDRIMRAYPHELSGGMLQRLMIVMALALKPELIIADEPTTALDVITQYEVLKEFQHIKETVGCAMIFISHDLAVVKHIADDVLVMKDGDVIEYGPVKDVLENPQQAYTQYLVNARRKLTSYFQKVRGDYSC